MFIFLGLRLSRKEKSKFPGFRITLLTNVSGFISRAWCKTIVTSYIKWGSYSSFTPNPRSELASSFCKWLNASSCEPAIRDICNIQVQCLASIMTRLIAAIILRWIYCLVKRTMCTTSCFAQNKLCLTTCYCKISVRYMDCSSDIITIFNLKVFLNTCAIEMTFLVIL